ncbi:MAG: hypothetical protein HQK55_12520 [Deltaproteobacteria bacterium]|nr:hypothetical protein [Deltaproteobacteria bacterium]
MALTRHGIPIHAYVDQVPAVVHAVNDIDCITPAVYFSEVASGDTIVILASVWMLDEMIEQCEANGLIEYENYLTYRNVKPFDFDIDVSGVCNLSCLTCPQGNYPSKIKKPMMNLATFKKVLHKIIAESPLITDVQLYSWGDPLLNNQLPEMIEFANSNGIASSISSNLSMHCDLDRIVRAKPAWFRISMSGYGDNYPLIHRNGNWKLVLENLHQLSRFKSSLFPEMNVEVNFHLYRHNKSDVSKIKQLCQELNFNLSLSVGMIYPLEFVIDYLESRKANDKFKEGLIYLDWNFDQAEPSTIKRCGCENELYIDSELKTFGCVETYNDPSTVIADNFLSTPLDDIIQAKSNMALCHKCKRTKAFRYQYSRIIDPGSIISGCS